MAALLAAESSSEPLWPIVIAGLFGLGAGAGGAFLGQLLARRHAREAWQNEQRLAAYATSHNHVFAAWSWAAKAYTNPEWGRSNGAVAHGLIDDMIRSSGPIVILGPDSVVDRLLDMVGVVTDVVTEATEQTDGDDRQAASEAQMQRYEDAHRRFVETARAALGIDDASKV